MRLNEMLYFIFELLFYKKYIFYFINDVYIYYIIIISNILFIFLFIYKFYYLYQKKIIFFSIHFII